MTSLARARVQRCTPLPPTTAKSTGTRISAESIDSNTETNLLAPSFSVSTSLDALFSRSVATTMRAEFFQSPAGIAGSTGAK